MGTILKSFRITFLFICMSPFISPNSSHACADCCGSFEAGSTATMPSSEGGMIFLEFNHINQNQNRFHGSKSPAESNDDKEISTSFYKIGGQYMLNRNWGVQMMIPYLSRHFSTTDDSGNPAVSDHAAIGDIQLNGVYAGFAEDMSIGIIFGAKLPTGDSTYANFDADTQIGTGSTDLLLGAYYLGKFTENHEWNWFLRASWDQPVIFKQGYRPGSDINSVLGATYEGWKIGEESKIVPVLELLASIHGSDAGALANESASGNSKLLISPGFEVCFGKFKINTDIQVPLLQYYKGNQLSAPIGYKLATIFSF